MQGRIRQSDDRRALRNDQGARMSMSQGNQRVAVVGGGISGLAAAHRLAALDTSVEITIFEASDRLGGVLQTEHVEGFCLELGPDSMLSRLPWGVDLCREIGLDGELVSTSASPSGVHVVCRGRLERVPEGLAVMAPRRIALWRRRFWLAWQAAAEWIDRRQWKWMRVADSRQLSREAFERWFSRWQGHLHETRNSSVFKPPFPSSWKWSGSTGA
jgi:oxygen-dependent protoporphyrinogen oxidase